MPNQLKKDPTRTTILRQQFVADMVRRFKALSLAIQELVVDDDAFGLETNTFIELAANQQVERHAWRFQINTQKVQSYRRWLKQQVDNKILTSDVTGKPWTASYIESAYRKGAVRSFIDVRKGIDFDEPGVFTGSKEEFLRSSFAGPVATSKIEFLYTRTFTELEGVTAAMDQQMSRILADGLAAGQSPRVIARSLRDNVTKLTNTRAKVIARTEIIRAHSEGQLDALERLGVEKVGVMVEWSTAGDDRVCVQCEELEGVVMTIEEARGLVPRHPNCRCAWIPANVGERRRGQLRGADKDKAVADSIQAEAPKTIPRTKAEVERRSTWIGKLLNWRT